MVQSVLREWTLTKLTFDDFDREHRIGNECLSEAAWAARLGADDTPALVLFRPDGSIMARNTGFVPPAGLIEILSVASFSLSNNALR